MHRSTRARDARRCWRFLILAGPSGARVRRPISRPARAKRLQQQLAAKRVQSVVINKYTRSMRVTLKDGTRKCIARYPKKQSAQTAARAAPAGRDGHLPAKKQGDEEAKKGKKHHHKIRYIVGGVLIVVILSRRRRAALPPSRAARD